MFFIRTLFPNIFVSKQRVGHSLICGFARRRRLASHLFQLLQVPDLGDRVHLVEIIVLSRLIDARLELVRSSRIAAGYRAAKSVS